jgi:opacity protein-like surface antigen
MKSILAILFITTLSASPAFAGDPEDTLPGISDFDSTPAQDDYAGGFWLGIGGGYAESKDADDGDYFTSAIFMADVLPFVNVYVSIGLATDSVSALGIDLDIYQYPLDIGVRIYPLGDGWIRPYTDLALGWYYLTIDWENTGTGANDTVTDNLFGYRFGFGVEFQVSDSIILDVYAAWRFLEDSTTDADSTEVDSSSDRFDIGAGIIFSLG